MKYDQKFRAMKILLGVKIGFKNFLLCYLQAWEPEVKKAGSFLHKFRYDMTKFGKGKWGKMVVLRALQRNNH